MQDVRPVVPVGLGAAGLLPFLAAAALALGVPAAAAPAAIVAAVYGAIILAFLGGVHWGWALRGGRAADFVWAVTPSLIAFFAALLPLPWMLAGLTAGFVLAGAYDVAFFRRTGPRWYVWLRVVLTLVVSLALALVAAAAPSDARLVHPAAILSALGG